jgi:pyruvate,water dikinase
MAEMEQALGGEYIFDRAFLESSVRKLSTLTYQVVYSLNAMSRNRYVSLFDRFQSIKSTLDDVLGGGMGPFAASLTLPYSALGWELEPLAGALNVCLAEARLRMDLPAPNGFAVTSTGCRLFMESNDFSDVICRGDPVELGNALSGAVFPPALEHAILEELEKLLAGRAGPVHLSVRACTAGGYGKEDPDLEGVPGVAPEHILSACRTSLAEYITKTAVPGLPGGGVGSVALAVHEAVAAGVAGSISSRPAAGFSAGLFDVSATAVSAPDRVEHYLLQRTYPFDLVRSDIWAKPVDQPLNQPPHERAYPSVKPLSQTPRGLYRGSSLLEPVFLKTLAETAMAFERMLGCTQELRWARGDVSQRPLILGIRPHLGHIECETPACDVEDAIRSAEVLLKGGETVQTGISAGRAIHVSENDDLDSFPHGAVAVARVASPRLSPVLRRASAVVTELGTSIGHLATVARELRVPAIFGAPEALKRIPDGAEVTVDAGERTVFKSIVEPLLACREWCTELYPSDPEYVALRRLLRWIMPLELIDPESSDFTADKCQTYHDIIHFSHERSVEELLHIQDRGHALADLHARKLDLGVPVELFVIDLGGGIAGGAGNAGSTGNAPLSIEDVTSEPFQPFLRGLMFKDMWSHGPASIRLRDIFSGLDRTFAAMTGTPEFAGMNHAIVAENYMNLGLRLGYHFSVVDSYLGPSMNQNYIYFRFVGGFADESRRRLRAELIRAVLEDMRFKVLVKGDLVVGKFKIAGKEEMTAALTRLGELTGFTRQLDISMASEEKVEELAALFRQTSLLGNASGT